MYAGASTRVLTANSAAAEALHVELFRTGKNSWNTTYATLVRLKGLVVSQEDDFVDPEKHDPGRKTIQMYVLGSVTLKV